jgi:hypothetical protein
LGCYLALGSSKCCSGATLSCYFVVTAIFISGLRIM